MTSTEPKIDTQTDTKGKTWFQAYGCGVVTCWFKSEQVARSDWAARRRLLEVAQCSG